MYKHLYDTFKRWYRGGSVYFYSDPHFADDEMKYLRKNYIGDDEQVKAINHKIGKNDTWICLGDINDIEYVRKIRGYKVLICGNHDKGASNYKRKKFEKILLLKEGVDNLKLLKEAYPDFIVHRIWQGLNKQYGYIEIFELDNHLFDEVYEGPLCISDKIILSHEPLDIPCMLNIHGHDHSNKAYTDKRHLNVCAEHIGYTPVSIKEIVESGALGKINSIHRETIDKATERSKKRK